ncbi:MAG: hypothetical protein KatS3mg105_5026 [Gemmatales bacterium]|nr:MAG: hypothetical protein KatS3mg105_5026 [Gemmatales bacterium]
MAHQFSVAVRNARAEAIESTIGTAPILRIRTGSPPANCAAARTGTILVSITLPNNWLTDASGGVKGGSVDWSATASATGDAGHFEIMDSSGTTCHWQGTVTDTSGSGDMKILGGVSIVTGQTVRVTQFQWTESNA